MKNFICLILSLVIIASSLLLSCNSKNPDAPLTTTESPPQSPQESAEDIPAETAPEVRPDIPAGDFGGRKIIIAVPTETLWGYDTVCPETETGEPVFDASYRRNKIIEDRYNVNLEQLDIVYSQFEKTAKNSVLAEDKMFDFAFPRMTQALSLAADGFLYDLRELPYIDSSNAWWDYTIVRDCSLAGKAFFLAGDINMYAYDGTIVLFFNKVMQTNYQIENLYQLVLDGKWTIDKFDEIMRVAIADLNGDGMMTFDDSFGLYTPHDVVTLSLLTGAYSNIFEKTSETEIIFNMGSEKFSNVIDKINLFMNYGEGVFNPANSKWKVPSDEWGYASKLFTEDRAFFMCEVVDCARRYRFMESDFGILPFPKYDESQKEYYSLVSSDVLAVGVPASMADADAELVGSLIEDMAYEGRKYILPAYYDITLLRKNTRDEESASMLDIIFKQRKYAVDMTYNFGDMRGKVYAMVNQNKNEVASLYEKNADKVQIAIDKLLEKYSQ